ncbi:SusC/RagA family TonB-linked outer membrane protein [Flammeovirga pacifica]|uniref:SusC/RagA family protein n=1 Tax=Flammeovirga pacifica TaxID=915059 RepID=A0A1S1Z589_FLAPC|nr:TonB-dependent receptor [Flammeovirga pacifica]OHX68401.1 SusC/RagA family protein [Flammeovirga pacifica]
MSINSTKQFAATMLLLLFSLVTFAQERAISGTVVDENGDTLPGVAVLVKGTTKGGTTDFDGKFKVTLADGEDVLVVSYIGYKSQEIVVGTSTNIDVAMEVDAEQLEEVVVIGYGSVKKEDATGSVQAITASDFNQGAITSPQDLLNGKVAGVQMTSSGGAPGAGSTIRIRGGSSLSASNDPLIVIDGVPIDNEGVSGMQNPLNTVNPNDIETFTVLKDASATAIYGSRASNGVILITTKKGSSGKLKIDYAGNVSVATVPKTVDVLNTNQFKDMVNKRYPGQTNVTDLIGTNDTDWQNEVLGSAVSTDHNVSVSGSVKDVLPFRASVGYTYNDGILNTSHLDRTTASLGLTPKLLDDHLSINVNAKFMNVKNQFADNGAIGSALGYDPTQQPKDPADVYKRFDGYHTWIDQGTNNPITIASANPVALLEQKDNSATVNRFIGNAQFDYKFHFLPELKANLNLGYDYSNSDGRTLVPPTAAFAFATQGDYSPYKQTKKNELLDFTLQYTKDLTSIDSRIDIMGGYSWQHFWREEYSYSNNFANDQDPPRQPERTFRTESYIVSFFGRLNYTFKDRYLFTATVRNDGTSRFSPDTRWGLFPALAFAWNMKKEGFLANSDVVSGLKLRLGYGITGQQNINNGDYPYLPTYTSSQNTADYEFYLPDGTPYYSTTLRPSGYDANIKWEETTTYNIGVDYGFLNDKITGTVDFYQRYTKDLLNVIPVPAGSNLTNQLLTNVGDLENKGVEFSINYKAISTSDLHWDLGFNVTYNENKITKLTQVNDPGYKGVFTGGIAGGTGNTIQIHSEGYPASSFFVYEQVYDANGNPLEGVYVDQNQDGLINDDDKVRKEDPAPNVYMGITSKMTYKNWDFSFAGRWNFGNYVYNNVASNNGYLNGIYTSTGGGYLSNRHADILTTGFNDAQYFSDYYVQNASFFRLDNIMLGYNFTNLKNGALNLRVYGTVNNVFVVTPYKGLDPEISGGIDNDVYPRPRTFLVGVNVGF